MTMLIVVVTELASLAALQPNNSFCMLHVCVQLCHNYHICLELTKLSSPKVLSCQSYNKSAIMCGLFRTLRNLFRSWLHTYIMQGHGIVYFY
jgi:hypothetical protein